MDFNKDIDYYSHIRIELVKMLPRIHGRFCEIGCGTGATLEYLRSSGASYVVGIDVNAESIELASKGGVDLVFTADVERDELPFMAKEFDGIIFADVLEHLYNPWDTLKKLTAYLADDGYVLLSLPNINNYRILRRLILHDEWKYEDAGILDNSHIRFFTLKGIKDLLAYAGLKIVKIERNNSCGIKMKLLNRLLFNRLENFLTVQYYVLAQKQL